MSTKRIELDSLSAKYRRPWPSATPLGCASSASTRGPLRVDSRPFPANGTASSVARSMVHIWWLPAIATYSVSPATVRSHGECSAVSGPNPPVGG